MPGSEPDMASDQCPFGTCPGSDPWTRPKRTGSPEAAAVVVGAEEVLAAGGGHRGARRDLERARGRGDDLREAVDLAAARAVDRREPVARRREGRAAADRADLEAGEADRRVDAALDAPACAVRHR